MDGEYSPLLQKYITENIKSKVTATDILFTAEARIVLSKALYTSG